MKRLLAIFVVLMLVLGGLLWHRRNENILIYTYRKYNYIPLINNLVLESSVSNHKARFPTNFSLYNLSRYQDILTKSYWSNKNFYDIITGTSIKKPLFQEYFKEFGFRKPYLVYVTKSKRDFCIYNIDTKEKLSFEYEDSLENNLKSRGIKPIQIKYYHEWLEIWKHDGRLPWFPKNVKRKSKG